MYSDSAAFRHHVRWRSSKPVDERLVPAKRHRCICLGTRPPQRGVSNVTINGTVHETAMLYSLAKTDVTAISRSHHPKGKKRLVDSFRAQAFVLQDKDRAWMLALSRQEEGPVDIELAYWHPVSRMTASELGGRDSEKYVSG